MLGLELNQFLEVGLFVAGQVQISGFFTLFVDDALQAVNVGFDLDELGFDELIRLAIDLLSRCRGILDVPVGQCVKEFDGAFRTDVVDLQLQDAGLAHPIDAESVSILADDVLVVSHLETLALCDGLFNRTASITRPADGQLEVPGLHHVVELMLAIVCLSVAQLSSEAVAL